jgi:hypothetical protein
MLSNAELPGGPAQQRTKGRQTHQRRRVPSRSRILRRTFCLILLVSCFNNEVSVIRDRIVLKMYRRIEINNIKKNEWRQSQITGLKETRTNDKIRRSGPDICSVEQCGPGCSATRCISSGDHTNEPGLHLVSKSTKDVVWGLLLTVRASPR